MKILIDICHPAHVHFFKHSIKQLKNLGHSVIITARKKECTFELLEKLNLEYIPLYTRKNSSIISMGKEILCRNYELYKVVKKHKPDIMTGIGGVFIAHIHAITRIPAIVFYDSDNAIGQNLITYPFASAVISPNCYRGWLPKNKHILYSGYHELAYLHPSYFTPNKQLAIESGLDKSRDNFFIRLVAWQASHDLGHKGFNLENLEKLVNFLNKKGKVIICAEKTLPDNLKQYQFTGDKSLLHHLLAFCKIYIGESPTMASECAILGVPSIFTSNIICGNMLEIENKYQLINQINPGNISTITHKLNNILNQKDEYWIKAKESLINETIDVSRFITDSILSFPVCLNNYQKQKSNQNA